ncbi:MAG: SDR family oxidoreductase [Verrucomicrobia bacterium]|nr:MAG: SDR family oxidoreductase [Verrucomicrobiota bacterium]
MSTVSSPRCAVVFGATGGIGSALVRQLVAEGWKVHAVARGQSRLDALAAETGAVSHAVDVTDPAAVDACLGAVQASEGRIDGVAHCVGSLLLKPAHNTTDADWAGVIGANLTSSFHVLRSAAGRMMRTGGGSIVLLSSAVAKHGMVNHDAIAAAKAGVAGLALSAAATYARYNLRVNCVAPGLTRTPLVAALTGNESMLKASVALHPLGRIGEPPEIARAIAWFLDPLQSWVTGQMLAVDGGLGSIQSRATAA